MNCLAVEQGEDRVVIDCGLLFPSSEAQLGVEVIAPDLHYLRAGPAPKAVLITHAHEDHVGGLPWLLRAFPEVPIYGTRFSLAVIKAKLEEFGRSANLREIGPRSKGDAGALSFEPLQVPHSIPDAVGYAIRTRAGTLVHTGDFKVDWSPIDGRLLDVRRFAELGEEGVACLLSDSTNAEREGTSTSEREVGESLARIFAGPLARGRVAVAMFGSNIHRVQSVVKASLAVGRKICLLGRSITQNVRLAIAMGFLKCPPELFVDPEAADHFAPRELTILCTGAQGEARAALSRLALGEHSTVQLEKNDLVIFSSRQIPGSERSVGALINNLVRRGCRVLTPDGADLVHTSGHACQGELRMMIDLLRPKSFVPIHGEYRMLAAHARLAESAGVTARACHVIEDGEVVELRQGELATRSGEKVPVGRLYLDGRGAESGVDELHLRDRQALADTGVVICLCVLDRKSGELIRPPEVFGKGVALDDARVAQASAAANEAFDELGYKERTDQGSVEEALRRAVRSVWKKGSEKRPMVLPLVVEL